VKLLPPVSRPPKFICVARNYAAHAAEANKELLEFPNLFVRFANTLVADGDTVLRPFVSDELDWEGELAFVIGKGGRHIKADDAYDHVFGYSIFNDVTVRDYQFRVPQFVAGKNFETSGPFGPTLVTRDEISDPHDLQLEVTVNDEVVQSTNTGDMIFQIPFLVEHISEFISLEPGDVIATGTPSGVGFVREPPRFLVPGDVMRVSVTGLGVLENPVDQEPAV
jgi:2-keto-4-pentenoate hydratase/2-oxohepta-3-ene-1,7-dioic acid hydratase in catechol pathway